jgi:hypothetical protein
MVSLATPLTIDFSFSFLNHLHIKIDMFLPMFKLTVTNNNFLVGLPFFSRGTSCAVQDKPQKHPIPIMVQVILTGVLLVVRRKVTFFPLTTIVVKEHSQHLSWFAPLPTTSQTGFNSDIQI